MESHNEKKSYIIKTAEFITSAGNKKEYPLGLIPEIAFAGRSNVGKSTLINCLVNRKKLVKTSNTPGRTQRINFFEVNNLFRFVDLPGYGYAKVSKTMRSEWEKMIEDYLLKRTNLCCLVWIMDIRRDVAEFEENFALWLAKNKINYINVLTKADKLSKTKQIAQKKQIASKLGFDEDLFITASGIKGTGKEKVWEIILNYAGVQND